MTDIGTYLQANWNDPEERGIDDAGKIKGDPRYKVLENTDTNPESLGQNTETNPESLQKQLMQVQVLPLVISRTVGKPLTSCNLNFPHLKEFIDAISDMVYDNLI